MDSLYNSFIIYDGHVWHGFYELGWIIVGMRWRRCHGVDMLDLDTLFLVQKDPYIFLHSSSKLLIGPMAGSDINKSGEHYLTKYP